MTHSPAIPQPARQLVLGCISGMPSSTEALRKGDCHGVVDAIHHPIGPTTSSHPHRLTFTDHTSFGWLLKNSFSDHDQRHEFFNVSFNAGSVNVRNFCDAFLHWMSHDVETTSMENFGKSTTKSPRRSNGCSAATNRCSPKLLMATKSLSLTTENGEMFR